MIKNYLHFIHKKFSVKGYVIISVVLMITSLFIFTMYNVNSGNKLKNREKILIEKITDLEKKYRFSQATIDHLNRKVAEVEQVLHSIPPPPDLNIERINDPINYLKKDLIKRNDLIPYTGVLGGAMGFYDENSIHVLNYKWIYAYFEDGHIGGEILLEYNILEDGRINWKVIDAFR
jgi:uncharacterized coiled-coil protein SlyX